MRESLRTAFAAAGISRVDIIDDAFDREPTGGLGDSEISAFISSLDDTAFDLLGQVLGIGAATEDEIIAQLSTIDGAASLYAERAQFGEPGNRLFEGFNQDTEQSKSDLEPLISLLDECGLECRTYGQDYDPDDNPPDIVFIDLKLTHGTDIQIDLPIAVLRKLDEKHKDAAPVVFLMSSLEEALEQRHEEFRKKSELYATQFETLKKSSIKQERDLIRQLVEHAKARGLIRQVHAHRKGWQKAVRAAEAELVRALRDLDLPDYFVLKDVSALHEGVGLGTYITDLLLEFFAHHIEGAPEIGDFAKDLDGWDIKNLPRTRFHVEPAVERVYCGNLLHHRQRIEGETKRGIGVSHERLRLGDIFLSAELSQSGMPQRALVVMTPECDLARPDDMVKRGSHVLLCEGEVAQFYPHEPLRNLSAEITPVLLEYRVPGTVQDVKLIISWKKKRPSVWNLADIKALAEEQTRKWHHAGRLRPLFALELQHTLTADLSRVGVQGSPAIHRPHGLTVLVRKDNVWECLYDGAKSDAAASAVCDDRPAKRIVYMIRDALLRQLLGKLDEWCTAKNTQEEPYRSLCHLLTEENVYAALKYSVMKRGGEAANKPDTESGHRPLRGLNGIANGAKNLIAFARPTSVERDKVFSAGKQVVEGEEAHVVFCFLPVHTRADEATVDEAEIVQS